MSSNAQPEMSIYRSVLTGDVPSQEQLLQYGYQTGDMILECPAARLWTVLQPGDETQFALPEGWAHTATIGN